MDVDLRDLRQLTLLIRAGNYRGMLEYLNAMAGFRYTALYRRDDPDMWNVVLFDAQNADAPQFPQVPAGETYCSMAMRDMAPVVIRDALDDARTTTHPAREVVRSYCGAPLVDGDGTPIGTLCHFDFVPVDAPGGVDGLMAAVASLLSPAALDDSLRVDLDARLGKLERMLPLLAATFADAADRAAALDEYTAPIDAMAPRLCTEDQQRLRERVAQARDALLAMA